MKKREPKPETPALHIPREHQSAPKEHWADKEIRKAAEEIDNGQFVPVRDDDDFLAVGLQRGTDILNPAAIKGDHKEDLIQQTADSMLLAQHPRVQEALRRLEQEKREAKNPQQLLDKSALLHEMNERAAKNNQWDGQGRWMGKDAEEMRIVNIMTPFQFVERLERVIGENKIFLNRFAVYNRVALLAPDRGEKSLIILPGMPEKREDGLVQVGTLQYPCGPEWMVPRFNEYGIVTTAKYLGWRTALLSMISLRVITEKQAHKAFPLNPNQASAWYREQLFTMRGRDGMAA